MKRYLLTALTAFAILTFSLMAMALTLPQNQTQTSLVVRQLSDRSVEVKFNLEKTGLNLKDLKKAELIRTTSSSKHVADINKRLYPTFKKDLFLSLLNKPIIDNYAADNTTYFYVIRITDIFGKQIFTNIASITTENRVLILTAKPTLFVDKEHYLFEVRVKDQTIKRYPMVLGENPKDRKLHSDFATTPEGVYQINGVRPKATYYKAYDINYPNAVDKYRYALASQNKKLPEIGGDIQIHGSKNLMFSGPLDINWTWGCMSLRNSDLDELFATKMISLGVTVAISGTDITRDDMESMLLPRTKSEYIAIQNALKQRGYFKGEISGKLTTETMKALCDFQANKNFPITCGLDLSTLDDLVGL